MNRRAAIVSLAIAAGLPRAVGAQSRERVRRIGVFMDLPPDAERGQTRLAAFLQGLQETGWHVGRNVRIDYRWHTGDAEGLRRSARELAELSADVLLASSSPMTAALQRAVPGMPIVFVAVVDPVGQGFVDSFARPGRNLTGFTTFDPMTAGKWFEILREADPTVRRAAFLSDPELPASLPQVAVAQKAAATLGLTLEIVDVRERVTIARAFADLARTGQGGVVVAATSTAGNMRDTIIALAASHRVPTVYPYDHFAQAGGLIAYGPDITDSFRSAAAYVDRILRGARPADLPVQAPTRFEMVVNLRTARDLGLTLPPTLLQRADEVIE